MDPTFTHVTTNTDNAQHELISADQLPEPDLEPMVREWLAATDPHPAWLGLLANLGSTNSQRTYRGHLKKAAQILCERNPIANAKLLTIDGRGRVAFKDPSIVERLPWHQLTIDLVQWVKLQACVRDDRCYLAG